MYANAVTGVKTIEQNPDKIMFGEGDIVGCGVEAVFKRNKLKPQQTIKVYFTKNGTRVGQFIVLFLFLFCFYCFCCFVLDQQ